MDIVLPGFCLLHPGWHRNCLEMRELCTNRRGHCVLTEGVIVYNGKGHCVQWKGLGFDLLTWKLTVRGLTAGDIAVQFEVHTSGNLEGYSC